MVRIFRAVRRRRGTILLLADSSVEISGIFSWWDLLGWRYWKRQQWVMQQSQSANYPHQISNNFTRLVLYVLLTTVSEKAFRRPWTEEKKNHNVTVSVKHLWRLWLQRWLSRSPENPCPPLLTLVRGICPHQGRKSLWCVSKKTTNQLKP